MLSTSYYCLAIDLALLGLGVKSEPRKAYVISYPFNRLRLLLQYFFYYDSYDCHGLSFSSFRQGV